MSLRHVLMVALIGLIILFVLWMAPHGLWALLGVFALPPLALLIALLRGASKAGFWASLLALLWFSHGVMEAWSSAQHRNYALIEIALALVVIFSASLPGLRGRFGKRSQRA